MRILFKIFPQKSHLNATFPLARSLRELGHEVVYAGVEQLRSHVESQGNIYFVQTEDVYPYVESRGSDPKLTFGLAFAMWWTGRKWRESMWAKFARCDAFDALVRATKPHFVFVDSPYTFFALSIYKHKIPFGMLESMSNLDRAPGCPPLDTDYVPKDSWLSRLICTLHWRRYFIKRWVLGGLGFRADFNKKFVLRMAKNCGVDPSVICFDRYFHLGLRNVPEFILASQVLDFPREPAKNQFYIGPSVEMNRVESSSDYSFKTRFAQMVTAREQGVPLVYCSLGTAGWRYKGAERFLKRVVEASRGASWNLVVAVGMEFDLARFDVIADNAAVFQVVPQLQVLKNADLMITHGGANSITECILSGVPMLVYPGTNQIDQTGNAARVVYHGVGLKGSLARETTSQISAKVLKIVMNSRSRARVNAIRQSILLNYSVFAAANALFGNEKEQNDINLLKNWDCTTKLVGERQLTAMNESLLQN